MSIESWTGAEGMKAIGVMGWPEWEDGFLVHRLVRPILSGEPYWAHEWRPEHPRAEWREIGAVKDGIALPRLRDYARERLAEHGLEVRSELRLGPNTSGRLFYPWSIRDATQILTVAMFYEDYDDALIAAILTCEASQPPSAAPAASAAPAPPSPQKSGPPEACPAPRGPKPKAPRRQGHRTQ